MEPGDFLAVNVIVDSADHAVHLAETLVLERLAATAPVEAPHEAYRLVDGEELAVYREWTVRAITIADRFDALCERAAGLPGIVVPGITAAPLTLMHPRLEGWLRQVLRACGADSGTASSPGRGSGS